MNTLSEHSLTACYRVTVLFDAKWVLLHDIIASQTEPSSDEVSILDALIDIATPTLAQRAFQYHVLNHQHIFQQLGLQDLTFYTTPDADEDVSTIWGDLTPEDIIPEMQAAVETAAIARATVPYISDTIFWPLVGAFYNAVDNRSVVPSKTWDRVSAHPEAYALLKLRAVVDYGNTEVGGGVQDNTVLTKQSNSEWRYCQSSAYTGSSPTSVKRGILQNNTLWLI